MCLHTLNKPLKVDLSLFQVLHTSFVAIAPHIFLYVTLTITLELSGAHRGLDSVNALAIYNEDRMLAEYLHTFINTFRQREVLSVILNVPDQTPPGVLSNLDLYCTDLVDRGQVVIH